MARIAQADDQLVSSFGASRLLQRDRQTVERAVRHLVPDGYTANGRPRWRLSRIVDVLARPPQQRHKTGRMRDRYRLAHSKVLDGLVVEFETQVAAIGVEPSLARKRQLAVELAPTLARFQAAYLDVGGRLGIEHAVLTARGDLVWSEMLTELCEAAQWPSSDFSPEMMEAVWPGDDDDGDEAA